MTFPFLDVLRLTDDDQLEAYLANLRQQAIDWNIRNRQQLDAHNIHLLLTPDGEVVMGWEIDIRNYAKSYDVPYLCLRSACAQIEVRITSIREARRIVPHQKETTVAQMNQADCELRQAMLDAGFQINEAHHRDCLTSFFRHQRYFDQTVVDEYARTGELPVAA